MMLRLLRVENIRRRWILPSNKHQSISKCKAGLGLPKPALFLSYPLSQHSEIEDRLPTIEVEIPSANRL